MAEWVAILISAVSLLFSFFAFRRSSGAQREANAAQQRIVEIEERREHDRLAEAKCAELRPELRASGGNSYRLYIANAGVVEAKNVRVIMDGQPLAEHPAAARNDAMPTFVGPQSEIGCLLRLHTQCQPPFEMEVIWDDDSGMNRSYRTTVTF